MDETVTYAEENPGLTFTGSIRVYLGDYQHRPPSECNPERSYSYEWK